MPVVHDIAQRLCHDTLPIASIRHLATNSSGKYTLHATSQNLRQKEQQALLLWLEQKKPTTYQCPTLWKGDPSCAKAAAERHYSDRRK